LLVPAGLASARDGAVHQVIGHKEKGLQLQSKQDRGTYDAERSIYRGAYCTVSLTIEYSRLAATDYTHLCSGMHDSA
jgi:hypothetical protein